MKPQARVENFKKDPLKSLFILSLPVILGMFLQILYNIIDTGFIGRLGVEQLAAATFSFPLFFLFIALANLVGLGASTLIAQHLGAKKQAAAENVAWHALVMSTAASLIFSGILLPLLEPIFRLLGATENVVIYGVQYMRPLILGSIFIFLSSAFRAILNGQGETKLPVIVQALSTIINLLLDYIFIIIFGWGMMGAALSTVIAFAFNVVVFSVLLFARRNHHLSFLAGWNGKVAGRMLAIGTPASIAQLFMSFSWFFFNYLFATFGTVTVSAYGLVGRIDSMVFLPMMGLSVGLVTLSGMFYGAGEYDLLRRVLKAALSANVIFSFIIGSIVWLFPEFFFRLLTPSADVISAASSLQRVEVFTYPFMALGFTLGRFLLGLGDGKPSLVITSVRLFLVAFPLAWIFTGFGYGPRSIIVAMLCAGIVSSSLAVLWTRRKMRVVVNQASGEI